MVPGSGHPLLRPVDDAGLAVARVLFGLTVVYGCLRYPLLGWTGLLYREPTFFFPVEGLGWLRPLPGVGMDVIYLLAAACGVFIALGVRARAASALFALLFAYTELVDKTNYINHHVLITLLAVFFACAPAGGTLSLERRWGWGPDHGTTPVWTVWSLRTQLGLVYLFAGLAKLEPDWLLRGEPLHTWLVARSDWPVVGPWLAQSWVAHGMAVAGCIFDLLVLPALLWRRTRLLAWVVVLGFHVATGLLFNIGMFPLAMMGLTTIFFAPHWPRRWIGGHLGTGPTRAGGSALAVALALILAVQIVLPLRHLAYPGDVLWTHEGWRLSWRVLLTETRGQLTYRVVEPSTGRRWVVRPETLLTPRQLHVACANPDMILQLAHHIRDDKVAEGVVEPQVFADAWLSLNGRPSARLVDPAADLAAQPTAWVGPWPWVTRQ